MKKRNTLFIIFITAITFILILTGISQAITVTASPNPATVGQNVTVNVTASLISALVGGCNVMVTFGDGSPTVNAGTCTAMTPATCALTTNHKYTTPGTYTITATKNPGCPNNFIPPDPATTSITINCVLLTMTTTSPLPSGTVGQAYSSQIQTSGGQAPINFSLVSGSLPPGLTLSSTGLISGTPTTSGNYSFTIRAIDNCPPKVQTVQRAFTLQINPAACPSLSITSPSTLSSGTVGLAYSYQVMTSGGQPPVTFSHVEGTLPPGLTVSSSGLISGTPTTAGDYSFTVKATDSCSLGTQTAERTFSIKVQTTPPPPPTPVTISVTPSSFSIPRGQSSSSSVNYRFTGPSSLNTILSSFVGSFVVGSETIETNPLPLTVNIQNGSGIISEVINIPVRVIERAIQRGSNRISYTRAYTGPDINLNATVNLTITTEAGAAFDIKRIELYFENRRAETTVERNYPHLKAFADIRFVGSGLLQGYWEVDGRILSYVNQHLTYGRSITLQTPEIPYLPTFDTGTHIVKFFITNPTIEIPLPSIIYFVTPTEFKGKPIGLRLMSPEDKSLVEYAPLKFEWAKLNKTALFLIQYFDRLDSRPIFSAYTKEPFYSLPEIVLKSIFSLGQKYYWKVMSFDAENNIIGESTIWSFSFKKLDAHAPGQIAVPNNKHNFMRGTSMSSAYMNGILAFALEKDKSINKQKLSVYKGDIGKWEKELLKIKICENNFEPS